MAAKEKAILVTGGAGYIGSHTVKALAAQGEKVVVLDNLVFGHREALDESKVTFVEGDMADREVVAGIFDRFQVEAVLHFAAYCYVGESVSDPLKYYANNLAAPFVLLEGLRDQGGGGQFIFSSTCATYGDPQTIPMDESHRQEPVNPYGASKLMLERVLKDCGPAFGLRSVFLRYFNASGCALDGSIGEDHDPETHLIPLVLMAARGDRENITVFGTDYDTPDGTCVRDYIHVEDLASAHLKALAYLRGGGETVGVNLGTGEGASVKEIISLAGEVTGKEISVVYGDRRPGDPSHLVAAPAKAKEVLGWEAEHKDVRTMIESAWGWMTGSNGGRY